MLCRRVARFEERLASWANCRLGIVGKAGAAAASVGPGGDLASEILSYFEVVGDRSELRDGRRLAVDLFRVGDGAVAVIALRDPDVKQGVVKAVAHEPGAEVVRCGAGWLRHGEGIVDGGAAGREDQRLTGISEPASRDARWRFAIVLHASRSSRRAGRTAGSGSSGRRVLPRRPLARAVIWRQKFCRTSRPSEIEPNCGTADVLRSIYSVWATAQPPSLHCVTRT